ncbi:MAG: tetratricopeptide (TPR) repeat protein [Flavobacteriaceae bacterium]|jgi:tetratricopeptide (TPR) repeat protein
MKSIIDIVLELKRNEVKIVRAILKTSSVNQKCNKLKLFNLIHSNKVRTNTDASLLIYNKNPNPVFYNLKKRLKNDILNTMLYSEAASVFPTQYIIASVNCRKWLLQGKMLINRGLYNEGISVLEKVSRVADKYDLPGERILAKETLRNFYAIREGIESLDRYRDEIMLDLSLYDKHIKAGDRMLTLSVPSLFQANYQEDTQKAYRQLLTIKKMYQLKDLKSERLGFYYYVSAINYYLYVKEYGRAKKAANAFLTLINESISLNTISNNGGAHLELSLVLLHLYEFENALIYSNKATQMFLESSFNRILTFEYSFIANFNLEKYNEALEFFENSKSISQIKSSVIRVERWRYMAAFCHYQLRNFKEAKELINDCTNLIKDKSGWYLGKRLLDLFIVIDEKEVEKTFLKLNNLLALFRVLDLEQIMRFKAIYKVVLFLSNNQFDFDLTYQKQRKYINLLTEGKDKYRWNPLGYEMIRFDQWFINHVNLKKL